MADFTGFITPAPTMLFGEIDDRPGFITPAPTMFLAPGDSISGGGGSPPVVTFIDPLPGTPIKSNKVCVVDITDPDGDLTLVCVNAEFPNIEMDEVISRGLEFTPRYASSLVSPIANGYRFTLIRNEGWPDELRLHAEAADSTGNVT